jgi:hypothetical protein
MGPTCQRQSLIIENSSFVHTIFDEYDFYMKIVALDEICNFLVWVFLKKFEIIKILKNYKVLVAY